MHRALLLLQSILPIVLLGASACNRHGTDAVVLGTTRVDELIAMRGAPERSIKPDAILPKNNGMLLGYPDGCAFQTQNEVIVAASCDAKGEERLLQYWRHKWQAHPQRFVEITRLGDPHGHRYFQLISDHARMAVVYEEAEDRVVRVVKYGPR